MGSQSAAKQTMPFFNGRIKLLFFMEWPASQRERCRHHGNFSA
jgi:hypothetical protein